MKGIYKIATILVLLVALGAGIILVRRSQETRKGAFFGDIDAIFLPETQNVEIGQQFSSYFVIDAKNHRLVAVDTRIKFDPNKLEVIAITPVTTTNGVSQVGSALFRSDSEVVIKTYDNNAGTIDLSGFSLEENESLLPTGMVSLLKIDFSAKTSGSAEVTLDSSFENMVMGVNPNQTPAPGQAFADNELRISNVRKATYTIGGGGPTTSVIPTIPASGDPSCTSLRLSKSSAVVGESILVSADFNGSALIRYSKVESEGQRVVDGQNPSSLQTDGIPTDTVNRMIFVPSQPGVYVFEVNTYDSADCRKLCSAGSTLYVNTQGTGGCDTGGHWETGGACNGGECIKWLTVTESGPTPTEKEADLFLHLLSAPNSVAKGGRFNVGLEFNVGPEDRKVSVINTKFKYDKNVVRAENIEIYTNSFNNTLRKTIDQETGTIDIYITSSMPRDDLSSGLAAATITFEATNSGRARFWFDPNYQSEMDGVDENGNSIEYRVNTSDLIVMVGESSSCKVCTSGIAKNRGNANCDAEVNGLDFELWRREAYDEGGLEDQSSNSWDADFNCDTKVNGLDFEIWRREVFG